MRAGADPLVRSKVAINGVSVLTVGRKDQHQPVGTASLRGVRGAATRDKYATHHPKAREWLGRQSQQHPRFQPLPVSLHERRRTVL